MSSRFLNDNLQQKIYDILFDVNAINFKVSFKASKMLKFDILNDIIN